MRPRGVGGREKRRGGGGVGGSREVFGVECDDERGRHEKFDLRVLE